MANSEPATSDMDNHPDEPSVSEISAAEKNADSFLQEFEKYPWDTDAEFQAGLTAILGPDPSAANPSQIKDLMLRARCFYYTRKFNVPVDFTAYSQWRSEQPSFSLSALEPSPSSLHERMPSSEPVTPERRGISAETLSAKESGGYSERVAKPRFAGFPGISESGAILEPQPGHPPVPKYSASFQEVVETIQQGKPLPGIEHIPDTVLRGHGSKCTMERPLKPWERYKLEAQES